MSKYYPESKVEIVGIDISREMIRKFKKRCSSYTNAKIIRARIDKSLTFKKKFDKVFISFVLHGFPQDVREVIIKNAFNMLKSNGSFLF